MKRLHTVFLSFFALFGLTACLDQIKLSQYSIEYPIKNQSYIGTVNEPAPNDDGNPDNDRRLEGVFKVNYGSKPSGPLKISLNGNDIGGPQYFSYGPTQATADIEKIKQFFRQGKNTLSVELLSLGPQITFNLDAAGPDIIITRGESKDGGVTVEIEGFLRDDSSFGDTLDVDLTQIEGHDKNNGEIITNSQGTAQIDVNPDGSFSGLVTVDGIIQPEEWKNNGSAEYPVWEYIQGKNLLYTLRARDEHGYDSKLEILADINGSGDSLPINNALRVAIGDSFIESMRPVIAAGIYSSLEKNPISGGPMGPFKVDIGLGNMPTTVNYFHLASGKELDPEYEKPEDSPGEVDWTDINDGKGPNKATVLLNGFKIKEGSILAVDMIITNVLAELTIELPPALAWLIPSIELGMYIERINVETDAIVQAAESKVDVQLGDSNFALQGIQTTQVTLGLLNITALAGALIPLLEGLIGDLLPSLVNPVIADNLSRIVIGQRIYRTDLIPEDIDKTNLPKPDAPNPTQEEIDLLARLEAEVPYTDFRIDIAELGTGNKLGPALPYDLLVGIQSKADTGKSDPYVKPILGTYFNDDPINPNDVFNSLGNSGTNISMAIKSNLINQLLAGVYSIGQMHLTLYKDETLFGANPHTPVNEAGDGTSAAKGDMRTRLWPEMPPIFKMQEISASDGGSGVGKASITYPSATLAVEKWDGTNWQTEFSAQVDFDLAILVDELDGAVTLGAAGPPVFNVNKVVNNSVIQVPEIAIQIVLDAALFFGGDAIADQVIPINLNDLAKGLINGTQATFLDANDDYRLADANGDNPGECKVEISDGVWGKCNIGDTSCDPEMSPLSPEDSDGKDDMVCETLNFVVQTDTVGTIGNKGSNLFFQMGARDPEIPPPPAVPRLDLDKDGVIDYRDNCAMTQTELAIVINELDKKGHSLADAMLTEINEKGEEYQTGEVSEAYKELLIEDAEAYIATKFGGSANAVPLAEDLVWYNYMRKQEGDELSSLDPDHPWLTMLFANPSQFNTDGDRVGELCEDDYDRDGVYADNVPKNVPDNEHKYWVDNCPHSPQFDADENRWVIDGSTAYYDATETDDSTKAGDVCDVRKTFVLLRSLESKNQAGGVPRCLARGAAGGNWISDIINGDMPECDPNDLNQRFYMSSVNGTDLTAGFEFFTAQTRDQNTDSRLAAYGYQERDHGGCTNPSGADTYVTDMRLVNVNDAFIIGQNAERVGNCAGTTSKVDRADPIWWPVPTLSAGTLEEAEHPWYIHTDFNFNFSTYWGGYDNNTGATCMVWSPGFGVDVNAAECPKSDPSKAEGLGEKGRWAIWVGGNDVPWNGKW